MFEGVSTLGIVIVVAILLLVFGRGKIMSLIEQFRNKETPTGESKKSEQEGQPAEKEDSGE